MISTSGGGRYPGALPGALCAHLVHGLHAAAQPLTILLAGLSKENTEGMLAEDLRKLTASSMSEVQRVCTLFHLLQQLVAAESAPVVYSMTLVPPLLLQVIDGLNQLFTQQGVHVHCVVREPCPPLVLDRGRILQALVNVLLAANTVSRRHDTVEVTVSGGLEESVVVDVWNDGVTRDTAPLEWELSLAVAEANIRSAKGVFWWSLQPFHVQMKLRPAP